MTMERNYEVRYKGRIEHRDLDAQGFVELVRSGQISGVHAYRATGTLRWLPVFRMEHQRDAEGRWTIIDEAQPARPQQPLPPIAEPPPPPGPQISNPSVVIMTGGASAPAHSAEPARTDPKDLAATQGAGLSIAGFTLGVISVVVAGVLFAPPLFRIEIGIAGVVVAGVAIVLSACGLPTGRRRGLAVAGMVTGIVMFIGWSVFIAYLILRVRAK